MKKYIALIFLSGAILGSFILLKPKTLSKNIAVNNPPAENSEKKVSFESIQTLASINGDSSGIETPEKNPNITAEIGKKIAQEFLDKNPQGPETIDQQKVINTSDPENLALKLMDSKVSETALNLFNPVIKPESLKIDSLNDNKTLENYLREFKKLIQTNFVGLSVDFSNPTIADFENLTTRLNETIGGFYALRAPAPLFEMHREEIRLLTVQKNIFESLKNYETDPVLAMLAIEAFTKNDTDFLTLRSRLNDFVVSRKLTP